MKPLPSALACRRKAGLLTRSFRTAARDTEAPELAARVPTLAEQKPHQLWRVERIRPSWATLATSTPF
jgi:hypothetical protein